VVGDELPVSTASDKFDGEGRLVDPLLAERLRSHLAVLVEHATPLGVAA
jgi:hypothetical protein